ncbi:MAG: hypothetical protein M1372_01370 [Patescibacteria group bacterium]|nr:hypothetical protein [Patescibacteria group bacterium]
MKEQVLEVPHHELVGILPSHDTGLRIHSSQGEDLTANFFGRTLSIENLAGHRVIDTGARQEEHESLSTVQKLPSKADIFIASSE